MINKHCDIEYILYLTIQMIKTKFISEFFVKFIKKSLCNFQLDDCDCNSYLAVIHI